eukprot:Em0011g379a
MATIRPRRAIILTLCTISAVMTTLWASPVPVEAALMNHSKSVRSTSEAEAKGKLATLLTVILHDLPCDVTFLCTVKQEEVLPRPADVQEDMLDDFWRSLHSILQLSALDKIINQSTAQGIMLGQFTSPVSEQLISWISVRLNFTATSGCSKDKIDALRETLDVYKKFQNALDTLLGVASDQGLTDGISETDWIRKHVICKGTVAQATVSTVAHLYPSLNVTHSC